MVSSSSSAPLDSLARARDVVAEIQNSSSGAITAAKVSRVITAQFPQLSPSEAATIADTVIGSATEIVACLNPYSSAQQPNVSRAQTLVRECLTSIEHRQQRLRSGITSHESSAHTARQTALSRHRQTQGQTTTSMHVEPSLTTTQSTSALSSSATESESALISTIPLDIRRHIIQEYIPVVSVQNIGESIAILGREEVAQSLCTNLDGYAIQDNPYIGMRSLIEEFLREANYSVGALRNHELLRQLFPTSSAMNNFIEKFRNAVRIVDVRNTSINATTFQQLVTDCPRAKIIQLGSTVDFRLTSVLAALRSSHYLNTLPSSDAGGNCCWDVGFDIMTRAGYNIDNVRNDPVVNSIHNTAAKMDTFITMFKHTQLSLDLRTAALTADQMVQLCRELPNLEDIHLPATVTDETLRRIAAATPRLQRLRISGNTSITGEGLDAFASRIPQTIIQLDISGCTNITAAGQNQITRLTNLESFNASSTPVTNQVLSHFHNLQRVRLDGCPNINNSIFTVLQNCPNLQALSLSRCPQIRGEGLFNVSSLHRLHSICLNGIQFSAAGTEELRRLMHVEPLYQEGLAQPYHAGIRRLSINNSNLHNDDISTVCSNSLQFLHAWPQVLSKDDDTPDNTLGANIRRCYPSLVMKRTECDVLELPYPSGITI